jgi:hypothetical protein
MAEKLAEETDSFPCAKGNSQQLEWSPAFT